MSDDWNDWQDEPPPPRWRRNATIAAVAVLALAGGYGAYRFIGGLGGAPSQHAMEVVTLKLIEPPPPPPPPPPPVVKPPEPAKMLEQPQEKTPDKPKPAEKPPQNLALDAKGQHGSDSFGLEGRAGGTPLIGSDSGAGGGASRFGWYANLIQTEIQQLLQKDEKLRSGRYGITIAVWLSTSGRPDRVKLISTTGDHQIDQRIEQTLAAMPNLPQAPPHDMPQPVNLRIDARPTQ